jgi:hypothetical protein
VLAPVDEPELELLELIVGPDELELIVELDELEAGRHAPEAPLLQELVETPPPEDALMLPEPAPSAPPSTSVSPDEKDPHAPPTVPSITAQGTSTRERAFIMATSPIDRCRYPRGAS